MPVRYAAALPYARPLLPEVNMRLRPRLLRELKPGTRIVSHGFDMGEWKPDKERVVDGDHVYLWTIPEH
jgi:hypothetical protein